MSQPMEALARANEVRIRAAEQRRALHGKGERAITRAIINPTPELGSYRLGMLFTSRAAEKGPILGIGPLYLQRAFDNLAEKHPRCRQNWHTELRLRDLTQTERRRLVAELFAFGARTSQKAAVLA